jgi:hypothetical protein
MRGREEEVVPGPAALLPLLTTLPPLPLPPFLSTLIIIIPIPNSHPLLLSKNKRWTWNN